MKKLFLLVAAVVLMSALPAAAQIGTICGISTWGWLWESQAFGTVGLSTDLMYSGVFYGRYGSTSLSCLATAGGRPKSGVPVSFVGSTLWGGMRSTALTRTSTQGTVAAKVNWPADVYEMVVKSADGTVSSPAALTVYNSAPNTTYAGGALFLGSERRRATFGLRYGTSPTILSGLLFLDTDNPAGPVKITSTSFRRVASPAGTRKYNGICTFHAPGKAPEGANLFITSTTTTTGFTFSVRVVAVSMEVYYDVSARTVSGGAKWGP